MLMYLNRKYDRLADTSKGEVIRFSIFMVIILPIILIGNVNIQLPLLTVLIGMRAWYFHKSK